MKNHSEISNCIQQIYVCSTSPLHSNLAAYTHPASLFHKSSHRSIPNSPSPPVLFFDSSYIYIRKIPIVLKNDGMTFRIWREGKNRLIASVNRMEWAGGFRGWVKKDMLWKKIREPGTNLWKTWWKKSLEVFLLTSSFELVLFGR